jgi:CheY-like chemotaxis protein
MYSAMIMDDNWFNRDIFRIALENAGYIVTEAENGAKGLEILAEQDVDLLILDLQMPKIDGITVLKELRSKRSQKKMHVVVVTANAEMATSEVSAMADFVMYKPINVMEFADFVRRLRSTQIPN